MAIPDQLQATPRPVSVASGQAFLTAGFIRPVSGSLHLYDSLSLYCSSQLLTWGGPHIRYCTSPIFVLNLILSRTHGLLTCKRLLETKAVGSAPRHVEQFIKEGHLRYCMLLVLPGTTHRRYCQVLLTAGSARYCTLQVRSGTAHCRCY